MKLTKFLAIAAAGGVIACSDTTEPIPEGTTPITFNLCGGLPTFGSWLAYQNEGGQWTQVIASQTGQISINATPKVSVALSISFFGTSVTQVLNTTAAELQAIDDAACVEDFGSRSMGGTVAGMTGEQYARITAGSSIDDADSSDPSWLLEDLPGRAMDIVATRYATIGTQPSNRVLVRRNVTPNNGTIAALDFNSATESAALENATATFTGLGASASLDVAAGVLTTNGTVHELMKMLGTQASGSLAMNYVSVPAALRIGTDRHVIQANASSVEGTRSLEHYYTTPAAKTLAFGPMVGEPVITTVATSPYVRPRAQLASQPEYPGGVLIQWLHSTSETTGNIVAVLTTAGFVDGAPATWDITVPDMSSAGYPASAALQGTDYTWSVTVVSATSGISLFGGATPVDGTTVLTATRGSVEEFLAFGSRARRIPGRK